MEARISRATLVALVLCSLCSLGARYKSANFVVSASTPEIAEQVGVLAEKYRKELAIEWTGAELPRWAEPCPITVKTGPNLGAGGATSFMFDRGEVYGWRMNIQGSLERVLDSVLPHEVTHTIFASHFRQPLPRWPAWLRHRHRWASSVSWCGKEPLAASGADQPRPNHMSVR